MSDIFRSLTVAPALHPVKIEIFWVIFDSPKRFMNVFPQKSLDALFTDKTMNTTDYESVLTI